MISGLTNFRLHLEAYILRLAEKLWNVPRDVVARFGRKARAYLAIPFSLTSKTTPTESVIYVDTEHSLTGIPLEALIDIGEAMELDFRVVLAAATIAA